MHNTVTVQDTLPPQAVIMQMMMGAWVTKIISESTRLGIPDLVAQHGAVRASDMTAVHGVDAQPDALHRLLRACAGVGIFTEDGEGRFGPTDLSGVLTISSPVSVKKLVEAIGGPWYKGWTEFFESVRTGQPQARKVFGMEWWDYLNANPKELEDFGEAMKSNSLNSLRGVLEHCDFTSVKKIADIAGGFGHLAVALAEKYSGMQAIVMDVPQVIALARTHAPAGSPEIAERIRYVGGDMFEAVPPAEVYIMKHIIHDWEDEKCVRLLGNCVRSMQGDGRVICVDSVLPSMGDTGGIAAKLLDLQMMVFITGRERTQDQWKALYQAAGLEIKQIVPIHDNFGTSIVEGVRRQA